MHFVRGFAAWAFFCPSLSLKSFLFFIIPQQRRARKRRLARGRRRSKHPADDDRPQGAALWIQLHLIMQDKGYVPLSSSLENEKSEP